MALTDTKLRTLKPEEQAFIASDGGGLFIEVSPKGGKVWRLRYRLSGKQEKATLGGLPYLFARRVPGVAGCLQGAGGRGVSPMAIKRGDPIPEDATPPCVSWRKPSFGLVSDCAGEGQGKGRSGAGSRDSRSLRVALVCRSRRTEQQQPPQHQARAGEGHNPGDRWQADSRRDRDGRAGDYRPGEGAGSRSDGPADPQCAETPVQLCHRTGEGGIQPSGGRGGPIHRHCQKPRRGPVPEEVGKLLRAIYQSSMNRRYKLALHLLILCMVRKTELIEARWEEIDFDKAEWSIPGERMKKDKPHFVPLSRQAVAMVEELKGLASGSEFVFPSRGSLKQPIAHSTLNQAIRALEIDVRDFVIHDFRRTASTHLHEAGFNSDWIEKSLAHETKGIRGVYNRRSTPTSGGTCCNGGLTSWTVRSRKGRR